MGQPTGRLVDSTLLKRKHLLKKVIKNRNNSQDKYKNNLFNKIYFHTIYPFLILLIVSQLIKSTRCDCGTIKLLDSLKEYDGENADVLTGTFDGFLESQFTVSGFFKILGESTKSYSLFKFRNQASEISSRVLQEGSSDMRDILSISYSRYDENGKTVDVILSKNYNRIS